MVGASVAIRPISGVMIMRLSGGKIVKVTANTVGIMAPPMKPCSARHTIISLIEPEMAPVEPRAGGRLHGPGYDGCGRHWVIARPRRCRVCRRLLSRKDRGAVFPQAPPEPKSSPARAA